MATLHIKIPKQYEVQDLDKGCVVGFEDEFWLITQGGDPTGETELEVLAGLSPAVLGRLKTIPLNEYVTDHGLITIHTDET